LFYWLLAIASQGIKLHTLVSLKVYQQDVFGFVLYTISLALSVIVFILENIPRPKSEYMLLDEDEV
jgi:ATP-binding cassette, subfamily C (CFTR/MRP), member 1